MNAPSPSGSSLLGRGLLFVAVAAVLGLLVLEQIRLKQFLEALRAERATLSAQQADTRATLNLIQQTLALLTNQLRAGAFTMAPEPTFAPRIQRRLGPTDRLVPARPVVSPPAAPPANPLILEPPILEPPGPRVNQRPGWSTGQVLGPPDTERAGDYPSAWAPRQQDGGPEWLRVNFEKAVEVSQVRIRETHNPGAVSKVTAIVNSQEVTLWEGNANLEPAPREFIVSAAGNLLTQSIIIHLDTTRVPGWNEIDAVELIGKDGSRQWAISASASSSYADIDVRPAEPVDRLPAIDPIPAPPRQR